MNLLVLFLLLFVGTVSGARSATFKSGGNPKANPTQIAHDQQLGHHEQNSANNSIPNVQPTGNLGGSTDKGRHAQTDQDDPNGRDPVTWFTFGLVIVGLLQVWVLHRQATLQGGALKAAETAAQAARDSADVANLALRTTERAQLLAGVEFRKPPTVNEHPLLRLKVRNSGRTLGKITGWASFSVFGTAEPETVQVGEWKDSLQEVPPGENAEIGMISNLLPTEDQIHGLDDGTATFYILGVLRYLDVFGTLHETGFAFKTYKRPEGGGGFVSWQRDGARYWT
jgi:hypothetical protein